MIKYCKNGHRIDSSPDGSCFKCTNINKAKQRGDGNAFIPARTAGMRARCVEGNVGLGNEVDRWIRTHKDTHGHLNIDIRVNEGHQVIAKVSSTSGAINTTRMLGTTGKIVAARATLTHMVNLVNNQAISIVEAPKSIECKHGHLLNEDGQCDVCKTDSMFKNNSRAIKKGTARRSKRAKSFQYGGRR